MSEPLCNENVAPKYLHKLLLVADFIDESIISDCFSYGPRHLVFLIARVKPMAHCWETPTETRIAGGVMVAFL